MLSFSFLTLQKFVLIWIDRGLVTQHCKANNFTTAVSSILLPVQYFFLINMGSIIYKIICPYRTDKLADCYILWFQVIEWQQHNWRDSTGVWEPIKFNNSKPWTK